MEAIAGQPGADELALLALLPADGSPADGAQVSVTGAAGNA